MTETIIVSVAGLIVLRGVMTGADAYAAFLRGAARGMKAASGLLPALCAMLLMLAMLNASGLMRLMTMLASPLTDLLCIPQETAPLLLLRPLTGSGSIAALEQVFRECGVDSRAGIIASVLMGSSETIFYTMTVYLGASGIRRLPWVLTVSLTAYLAGAAILGRMI